jgi:23S rRNA G2445 N2-methylase RlmL
MWVCGLGFLSCISAVFDRITGINTFKHASLKGSSLEGAKENARALGLSDRVDFKKSDVFTFIPAEKFNIIVSNLVFHNFGKMRFKAYSFLSSWTQFASFVVIGDLFFSPKTDVAHLEKAFRILRQIKLKNGFRDYALLVMSRDSHGLS